MKMIDVVKGAEDRLDKRMQDWANEKMPVKTKREINAEKKKIKKLKEIERRKEEDMDMDELIKEYDERIEGFERMIRGALISTTAHWDYRNKLKAERAEFKLMHETEKMLNK